MSGLVDALVDYDAAICGGGGTYTAQLSIEAGDAEQAGAQAVRVFRQAAAEVGLPKWPLTRLEVVTEAELEADLQHPTIPELVGITEIAELLDVSKQRAWPGLNRM